MHASLLLVVGGLPPRLLLCFCCLLLLGRGIARRVAAHTKLPKCLQGTPVDSTCTETSAGVFERKWSKGVVRMDCNQWTGTVPGVKTDDPTIQPRLGGFLGTVHPSNKPAAGGSTVQGHYGFGTAMVAPDETVI